MKTAKANQTVTSTKDNRLSIEKDCNLGKLQNLVTEPQLELTEKGFIRSFKNGYAKALKDILHLLGDKNNSRELIATHIQVEIANNEKIFN